MNPLHQEILNSLPYPVERTALDIADYINDSRRKSGKVYQLGIFEWGAVSVGSLYPTLHVLERDGLIQSRWSELPDKDTGCRRKYYRKTKEGSKRLNQLQEYTINQSGLGLAAN